jgi:hypothetical protein
LFWPGQGEVEGGERAGARAPGAWVQAFGVQIQEIKAALWPEKEIAEVEVPGTQARGKGSCKEMPRFFQELRCRLLRSKHGEQVPSFA